MGTKSGALFKVGAHFVLGMGVKYTFTSISYFDLRSFGQKLAEVA